MKPFNITENTKGVLVYGETRNGGRWLILISSVEKRDNDLIIYRHFSYHLNSNSLYIINTTNGRCWGALSTMVLNSITQRMNNTNSLKDSCKGTNSNSYQFLIK